MNAELATMIQEREALLERVRRILIENLGVRREADEIDPDTPLFGTGLGLDSVDAVELLISVESEFDIRMPDEGVSRMALRTLNTVVDTVLLIQGDHGDR
jgi:acyl carrier protein